MTGEPLLLGNRLIPLVLIVATIALLLLRATGIIRYDRVFKVLLLAIPAVYCLDWVQTWVFRGQPIQAFWPASLLSISNVFLYVLCWVLLAGVKGWRLKYPIALLVCLTLDYAWLGLFEGS